MGANAVIHFQVDGTGKAVQQVQQVAKAMSATARAGRGAARLNIAPGGHGGGGSDGAPHGSSGHHHNHRNFTRAASRLVEGSPFARFTTALSEPTLALGAVAGAAAVAGTSLSIFARSVQNGIDILKESIKTKIETRGSIREATTSANQSAVQNVLGRKEELIAGARGTPEIRAMFAKWQQIQDRTERAELARAQKFGTQELNKQLSDVQNPGLGVMADLLTHANDDLTIQKEILAKMTSLETFVQTVKYGMEGKSVDADLRASVNNFNSIAAGGR